MFVSQVKESDNRPKQVCEFCSEKLELCYQFNKVVEEAERQFRASEEEHSTGLSVENILVLASPEPSSGSLDPNKTRCSNDLTTRVEKKLSSKNEYEKGDSSTFDSDSERSAVSDILEQTTFASEVSMTSCSRSQPKRQTSGAQCEKGSDNVRITLFRVLLIYMYSIMLCTFLYLLPPQLLICCSTTLWLILMVLIQRRDVPGIIICQ